MKRLIPVLVSICAFVIAGALIAFAEFGTAGVVMLSAACISVVPIGVGLARGKHDLFEPSYLFAVSFGILFAVRPFLEWSDAHGVPTMGGLDPTPTYLPAVVLASAGGLAFFGGYYSSAGGRLAQRLPSAPASLDPIRLRIGALVIAMSGVALYGAFLVSSGGFSSIGAVIAGRNPEFLSAVSQPAGYLYSGLLFLFPAGIAMIVAAKKWRSPGGVIGVALVLASILPAIFTGTRSATLPALLTMFAIWYLRRGSRPRLLTLLGIGLVGFVLVISVPRDFRNTEDRTGNLLDAVSASVSDTANTGREFFLGLDTAMLPALAIELAYVPEVVPHQAGSTYLEAALRPIPRAIWPDKPEGADTQLMRVLWPDLADQGIGLAFSFFGEPFLNFGVPGVLAIALLFGMAWRTLWEYWRRQPMNSAAIGIFAISWPFLFVYLRGGIGIDYQRQVIALVPFIALVWVAAGRQRAQAPTVVAESNRGMLGLQRARRLDESADPAHSARQAGQ